MYEELNKKLTKWVGLDYFKSRNFTESLDACFKWLVPKLDKLNITCGLVAYCDKDDESMKPYYAWLASVDKPYDSWFADAGTPALALCLAIEKLIDREANV